MKISSSSHSCKFLDQLVKTDDDDRRHSSYIFAVLLLRRKGVEEEGDQDDGKFECVIVIYSSAKHSSGSKD